MESTKTTLYLADELRARLKAVGAQSGKTVTTLLTEGAELILAKHRGAADREELGRRAREARERLRQGLYAGAAIADAHDERIYGSARAPRRRRK